MLHTQSFRQWTKHAGTNYLSTSKNTLSITHDKAWWDKVLPKYIFSPCGVNSLGRHFERGEFPWKRSFQSPWLHLWLRVVPSSAFLLSTSQTGSPLRLEQQGEINTLLPPFDMCSYTHVSMPTVLCVCVWEKHYLCAGVSCELWARTYMRHDNNWLFLDSRDRTSIQFCCKVRTVIRLLPTF